MPQSFIAKVKRAIGLLKREVLVVKSSDDVCGMISANNKRLAMLLATWFGTGLIKFAPGTWGSIAALPFAWIICKNWQAPGLVLAIIAVSLAGVWAISIHAQELPDEDPAEIVIDEVAGMWLTLLVVPPDLLYYFIGLVVFRIADILKPWPVSWADCRIKGAVGIMLDDIFAGVYAAIVLLTVSFIFQ